MDKLPNQGNGISPGTRGAPQIDMSEALVSAQRMLGHLENLVESATQRLTAIQEVQGAMTAALENAQAKANDAADAATVAMAAKTKIADEQAGIATKSEHIQAAQDHSDKVRQELDRIQTTATQQATDIEGLRGRAQTASDGATELHTIIRSQKMAADTELAAITGARDAAKAASAATKELADTADSIEERVGRRLRETTDRTRQGMCDPATGNRETTPGGHGRRTCALI